MSYHPSLLKVETMEKNIQAQEPTNLDDKSKKKVDNQLAWMLIKSGSPVAFRKGLHILIQQAFDYEPTPEDDLALAIARVQFRQAIEKRNSG